jgi:uncharacterized protein (TIGR02246 family)
MSMMKVCILIMASLALASTCLGQAAPTNQPDSPRIKPPTAASPSRGGPSSASANGLEDTLIAREKEVWEAIKKKDLNRFASFLAEDQVYVSSDGVRSKAETVKSIADASIPEVKLDDWKVMFIDRDAAIVTYRVTATPPACGPEMAAPVARNTTVWAKRGGKWLAVFHQDTTLGGGK